MPDKVSVKDDLLYSNVYTFGNLIGIPIKAVVDANIQAAEAAAKFIREYGFTRTPEAPRTIGDDDWGQLRMATFTYNYIAPGGTPQKMTVSIPVLSLIPLPLLIVDRAQFEFGIQVINHLTREIEINTQQGHEYNIFKNQEVYAMLAPLESNSNINELVEGSAEVISNMKAKVEIVQSDLPAGILQLINLSQEATNGTTSYEYQLAITPARLTFTTTAQTLSLTVNIIPVDPSRLKEEAVADQIITVEILTETMPVDQLFAMPIEITKGGAVGYPTDMTASAISGEDGEVIFQFTAAPAVIGNGFIKLSSRLVQSQDIYFNIDTSN